MKGRTNRKLTGRGFLIVLLIMMMTLFLTACTNDAAKTTGKDASATEAPTTQPTDELMEEERIIVSTPESISVQKEKYAFTISGEMAEKVSCREHADDPENIIEFYTVLNDREYTLFTILFNQNEGDIVHMISDADGNKIPVAFVMNALPKDISGECTEEFYMVQGVVNEIIEAIQAK